MATEHTDSVYLLYDRNGSMCESNDSVQLVRAWPGCVTIKYNGHNDSFHLIDWFRLTKYEKSLLLIELNDSFHFFCAKYDSFHLIE